MMMESETEMVKKSIEHYNSFYPTIMHIKADEILCEDERKRLKNVFDYLWCKDDLLMSDYKYKILRKLSDRMFKLGMITAADNITYHDIFRFNII